MWWFGKTWGAPICEPSRHLPDSDAPFGWKCEGCSQLIARTDCGVVTPLVEQLYLGAEPGMELMSPRSPTWCAWHLACFCRELGIEERR